MSLWQNLHFSPKYTKGSSYLKLNRDALPSEESQIEKDKHHRISLIDEIFKNELIYKTETDSGPQEKKIMFTTGDSEGVRRDKLGAWN